MTVPKRLAEAISNATQDFIASETGSPLGKLNLTGLICLTLFLVLVAVPSSWIQMTRVLLGKPVPIEIYVIIVLSIIALPTTTIVSVILVRRTESPQNNNSLPTTGA